MDYSIHDITVAALLHDLGKIGQRAKTVQFSDGLKQTVCPFKKQGGYFTHLHALYSSELIDEIENYLPQQLNPKAVSAFASKHHKPETPGEWLVTMGDWASAGQDRINAKDEAYSGQKFFEKPLRSMFSSINIYENGNSSEPDYYDLDILKPASFKLYREKILARSQYEEIWEKIRAELRQLPKDDLAQFMIALESLLLRYTVFIPSNTMDLHDISLYDHLSTTAGFAAALFQYHCKNNSLQDINAVKDQANKKLRLVSGDLSGIQNYIFSMKKSRGAAKQLRARSFELQMLSNLLSNKILDEMSLSRSCRIMDAGGRFLLVLPNYQGVTEELQQVARDIAGHFLRKYFGELSLSLAFDVEVSVNDLNQDRANEVFGLLTADLETKKMKRFQAVLSGPEQCRLGHEYEKITGAENVCESCGCRAVLEDDQEICLCQVCAALVDLGRDLATGSFLQIIKSESDRHQGLELLPGNSIRIGRQPSLKPGTLVYSLKDFVLGCGWINGSYRVPVDPGGNVLTFEEIAAQYCNQGIEKIAMFKADLDRLGLVFSHGLGKSVSMARYATLSRSINYFFSASLTELIEKSFPSIYVVFSGGDDLCLVGPWRQTVEFAVRFAREFAAFIGENPSMTVSGAIVMAAPKKSIDLLVQQSEAGLVKAKKDRNSFYVFGQVVSWKQMQQSLQDADKLVEWASESMGRDKLSKQMLYRLLYYAEKNACLQRGDSDKECVVWRSRLYYDARRNIKDENLREEFIELVVKGIDFMKITANTALYSLREK